MISGFTTEAGVFNDVKLHLGLMPTQNNQSTLATMQLVGDDYIIAQRLIHQHLRLQAQGWYAFNRHDRVALTYSDSTPPPGIAGFLLVDQPNGFVSSDALWAKTTDRLPADPPWPDTYSLVQPNGTVRIVRRDTNSPEFSVDERDILFDVCYRRELSQCPEAYLRWLAISTARALAPHFGVAIHPAEEANAKEEFMVIESRMTPVANTMTGSAETLLIWAR